MKGREGRVWEPKILGLRREGGEGVGLNSPNREIHSPPTVCHVIETVVMKLHVSLRLIVKMCGM
jgi:hypothetical protein